MCIEPDGCVDGDVYDVFAFYCYLLLFICPLSFEPGYEEEEKASIGRSVGGVLNIVPYQFGRRIIS